MLTIVLLCAAAITLIVLMRGRRSFAFKWDTGSTFLFVIGFAYMVPTAAAKLTSSFVYKDNGPFHEKTIAGLGWADRLVSLSDYAAITVAVIAFAIALLKPGRIPWTPLATPFIGIALLATSVTMAVTDQPPTGQPLMLIVALIAASVTRTSKQAIATGVTMLLMTELVLSTVVLLVHPNASIQPCSDKCTFVGEIFTGAASHGNGLALILTLGLPFVWLATRGKTRLWLVFYVLFVVGATGSRTSLTVAMIVTAVLALTRAGLKDNRGEGRFPAFAGLAAAAASAISLIMVLTPHDPLFVTGRGLLWNLAWQKFTESPLVGSGVKAWSDLYQGGYFGAAAAYSTHNQWMEVLLFSGVFGAVLLAWFTTSALNWQSGRGHVLLVAPIVLAIFGLGIFERPISISLVDGNTWALLGLIMLSDSRAEKQDIKLAKRRIPQKTQLPDWWDSSPLSQQRRKSLR